MSEQTYEERAIKLLEQLPDDFDYPTDQEFAKVVNRWWIDEVYPFLKEYYETRKGGENGSEG